MRLRAVVAGREDCYLEAGSMGLKVVVVGRELVAAAGQAAAARKKRVAVGMKVVVDTGVADTEAAGVELVVAADMRAVVVDTGVAGMGIVVAADMPAVVDIFHFQSEQLVNHSDTRETALVSSNPCQAKASQLSPYAAQSAT